MVVAYHDLFFYKFSWVFDCMHVRIIIVTDAPRSPEQRNSNNVPMHQRGLGVYTYPNGYQRVATFSSTSHPTAMPTPQPKHQPTAQTVPVMHNPQSQRRAAFYSDYEGEQTICSFGQEYSFTTSQIEGGSQTPQTISQESLQSLAMARRMKRRTSTSYNL